MSSIGFEHRSSTVETVQGREGGLATPQFVLAAGLSLVVFSAFVNLVVFQYGRGVVRAALDEGVRASAAVGSSIGDCQARADSVISDLLGGDLGRGIELVCEQEDGFVTASADVRFEGWVIPDWDFTLSARAVREAVP